MRVTGKGESPDDVPKVQQTMLGEMVLDAKKFPDDHVREHERQRQKPRQRSGRLTIHGVTQAGHRAGCAENRWGAT